MRLFNDIDMSDIRGLPRISFKGESKKTTVNIPKQSAEEAALQGSATNYANNAMGTANTTLGNANQVAGNFGNMYDNYTTNAQNVTDRYTGLLNGELPQQYQANRQQAINADLAGTVGSAFNNANARGLFGNSSITRSAMNDISNNASNALARSYSSDMSNYANILNGTATNNNNNVNTYNGLLTNQLGNAQTAAGNTSNLFNTMWNGRYGSAGTTTTQNDGGKGAINTAAQIGSMFI